MIKKIFTLSLVATMLAGFSMVAVQQPSEARGNDGCQQSFGSGQFRGNQSGNRFNTGANRFSLNSPYNNNGLSSAFGNQNFNNGNRFGQVRNPQKQALKQQRKMQQQLRRQQMAAAGIPFGNNGYNNGMLNVSNQLGVGNGAYAPATAQAYQQGYQAGVSSSLNGANGQFNNGFGVSGMNGLNGIGGLNGLNGLGGLGGFNGLNGVTGALNQGNGSGVSSILGRVLNGF